MSMKRLFVLIFCLTLAVAAQAGLQAQKLSSVYTGAFDMGAAEITAFDSLTHQMYFTNAGQNRLHRVDLSDPSNPIDLGFVSLAAYGSGPNSVAVGFHAGSSYLAVAVDALDRQLPGSVLFFSTDLNLIGSVTVGAVPDMLTFTADFSKVLVCNEGEPNNSYSSDPEGSVSIINVTSGPASATVTTAGFTSYNGQEAALRAQGIRIYGNNGAATAAQDFEPEYLAITNNGQFAYVTLQENNALAVLDIASATFIEVLPLGYKNWNVTGNAFDASDADGGTINIQNWPVYGMYQPDAIAGLYVGGQQYFVLANEGDAREYSGVNNEQVRLNSSGYQLDATVFPNAATLRNNANLGRLRVTNKLGNTDGDAQFEEIYAYGARSFSVRDASGSLVFDSGYEFENYIATNRPSEFNSNHDESQSMDSRSDDKGPEPEGVTVGWLCGKPYAFIVLERIGGVMVYDLSNPAAPVFETYITSRDTAYMLPGSPTPADLEAVSELGPEQCAFVSAEASPNGEALLLLSHEVSGSVSVYQLECVTPPAPIRLTILHNNDGESKLLRAGDGTLANFGGVARFKTVVDSLKAEAANNTDGAIMLSSGDNFLAGKEFNCSQSIGTYYDALALDRLGYDAISFGNHDFDFGPDVLADLLGDYAVNFPPYLVSNADFTAEPALQAYVNSGRIRKSTVVSVDGQLIGIVGAITPRLPFISSPRGVAIDPNVALAVQTEVDALLGDGVNKIILISHLQSIKEDSALIRELYGIDIAIAGGGSEVLANPGDLLVPGHTAYGTYPVYYNDMFGNPIPVVTTEGDYTYVGKLVVEFDAAGDVVAVDPLGDSGPVRVSAVAPDAVAADAAMQSDVVDPIAACVATLNANIIGNSDVALDGRRPMVRTRETNEGNLATDALLWQARQLAVQFGVPAADVALQNGGGIRNNSTIPAGNISEGTTFDILPFANFLSVAQNITPAHFKEVLENAVSRVEFTDGRFAQIAGFRFSWNPAGTAQIVDISGNVLTAGTRVRNVVLDNGTVLVENGVVNPAAANLTVATIDFLLNGGDQYPYRGLPFTTLGVTYQQSLANYIVDGLHGQIRASEYPLCGDGRITRIYDRTVNNPNGASSPAAWTPDFGADFHTADVAALTLSFPLQTAGVNPASVRASTTGDRPANVTEYDLPSAYTIARFWNIVPSAEDFEGATLTLRFTGCQLPSGIADPYTADLKALYSGDNGTTWMVAQGTLSGPTTAGVYSYTVTGLDHLSLWAIGAGDRILAVEMAEAFTAFAGDASVTLRWATASETSNDRFEINRDGRMVARVDGAGNSSSRTSYSWIDSELNNGAAYTYELVSVDMNGGRTSLGTASATPMGAEVITEYALSQNYPNPFNPSTLISFDLVEGGFVSLRIFNLMGQEIVSLVNGNMTAGRHAISFDASDLPSGAYLYRLEAGSFSATRKMLLMK